MVRASSSGLVSVLVVMAVTSVYLSRNPRSTQLNEQSHVQIDNQDITLVVYNVSALEKEIIQYRKMDIDYDKRNKVKEV